jgi:gliding motility-associated-like protein
MAQSCPPNIDFETGTFNNWTCYTGATFADGSANRIDLAAAGGPVANHHTLYSAANNSTWRDEYGNFPVVCPNGSGYSVKLGNNVGGGEAEGMSYEFVIPANQNNYSFIYHYAVVFQAPNHRPNEQPRMEIEVKNMTDNKVIDCASFTFISVGTSLPGFQVSTTSDTIPVLYKDWSAVSVDLSGNAGKTIRIFFKTADCTFRRHFGYAYLDVDSECGGSFLGATYCPDDTAVMVTAPFGYQGYTWYDSSLTNVLGTNQTITFAPPPAKGTTIAVKLDPYNGFGCLQTLYAELLDTLNVFANAGPDVISCNHEPVQIGATGRSGFVYTWSPTVGLSNPNISSTVAAPDSATTYYVSAHSAGGGCRTTDSVRVKVGLIDNSIQLIGKAAYCLGNNDSAVLQVQPNDSIQWFRNNVAIIGATKTRYRATQSGTYYAMLFSSNGCIRATDEQVIFIDQPQPGIRYPIQYAIINLPVTLQARTIADTVFWTPGTSLDTRTSFTPTFKGVSEKLYTIELRTKTGCLTVDTQQVKTIKAVEVYVPTAFTPNSDNKNDYLRPLTKGIKEHHYFRVFNRWGQLLYESKTDLPGWDGRLNGTAQSLQAVVWVYEGLGLDGKIYSQKGTTVLLR